VVWTCASRSESEERSVRHPPTTPLIATALWLLLGCGEADELRLHLATVTPDPLDGAAALRISYDAGDGLSTVEIPVDGGELGPGAGIQGEYIHDVHLEVLDSDGAVVARGGLSGDLTPPPGEVRDEQVVLLRSGVFSTLEGLTVAGARVEACTLAAGGATVLVAGGGRREVERLDLDRGLVTVVDLTDGDYARCRAAPMSDGHVVLAGDEAGLMEVVDGVSGALVAVHTTNRSDGALAVMAGGDAVWWMGGSADGVDLTSELLFPPDHAIEEGPVVHGGARRGHGMACVDDGTTCAVVGSDDGSTGWWRLTAASVLNAGPGTAIEPLQHEDLTLVGTAHSVIRMDDTTVVALLEHAGGSTLHALDLGGDGDWSWHEETSLDGGGTLLAVPGGELWWIGGDDGGPVDAVQRVTVTAGSWQLDELGANLREPRDGAAAAVLEDGRVVVIGGQGAEGPLASIEVYQP
jgi:hypothetical protein